MNSQYTLRLPNQLTPSDLYKLVVNVSDDKYCVKRIVDTIKCNQLHLESLNDSKGSRLKDRISFKMQKINF